jgi:hypothetical protein
VQLHTLHGKAWQMMQVPPPGLVQQWAIQKKFLGVELSHNETWHKYGHANKLLAAGKC